MSPAPNGSLALQSVKLSNALEIRDGIIFEFYLGLPHVGLIIDDINPNLSILTSSVVRCSLLCVWFSCPSLQFQADQPSGKQSSMMRVWNIFSGKMAGTTESIPSLATGLVSFPISFPGSLGNLRMRLRLCHIMLPSPHQRNEIWHIFHLLLLALNFTITKTRIEN